MADLYFRTSSPFEALEVLETVEAAREEPRRIGHWDPALSAVRWLLIHKD